ncbi:MAG: class I SAM-dependent methyltransferase [Gammaproteobacteria bacterium]|nr:class I SAM-dependent methyltransferase [Gammaproteobacteria bacterium]
MNDYSQFELDDWVKSTLADPVTKLSVSIDSFTKHYNIIDARVHLKNTLGHSKWNSGQDAYENWETSSSGYNNKVKNYRKEIQYDMPTYEYFELSGDIIDIGGGVGTVRELINTSYRFVSIDPYINAPLEVPSAKMEAYKCLSKHLNFVSAMAEFIPFKSKTFDWAHMRSMLDHVLVPDLALIEAHRILKDNGKLLVGMYVEGGKDGIIPVKEKCLDYVNNHIYPKFGINKYIDHHTWHPTYKNLVKLILDNGFEIEDIYWQPIWKDKVCYIKAKKATK